MTVWALVIVALVPFQSQPPEPKPVPSDSFRIVTAGCLKGRVFTATNRPETGRPEESASQGPSVIGRSFRVAAPREVMKEVKANNGYLVEVTGLVLKSSLLGPGPGARIGNTRVIVGGQSPGGDPMASARAPVGGLPVMDISSVRLLEKSCPIPRQ